MLFLKLSISYPILAWNPSGTPITGKIKFLLFSILPFSQHTHFLGLLIKNSQLKLLSPAPHWSLPFLWLCTPELFTARLPLTFLHFLINIPSPLKTQLHLASSAKIIFLLFPLPKLIVSSPFRSITQYLLLYLQHCISPQDQRRCAYFQRMWLIKEFGNSNLRQAFWWNHLFNSPFILLYVIMVFSHREAHCDSTPH